MKTFLTRIHKECADRGVSISHIAKECSLDPRTMRKRKIKSCWLDYKNIGEELGISDEEIAQMLIADDIEPSGLLPGSSAYLFMTDLFHEESGADWVCADDALEQYGKDHFGKSLFLLICKGYLKVEFVESKKGAILKMTPLGKELMRFS